MTISNMYLSVSTMTGGVTVAPYQGAIQVSAFSWGASSTFTPTSGGGGGGAGKATFQDLSLTCFVDTATSPMLGALARGTSLDSAVLTVLNPSNAGTSTKNTYTLGGVHVVGVSFGAVNGDARMLVEYALAYTTLAFVMSGKTVTWDLSKNTP